MSQERKFTLWFDEIRIEDVPSVGGKNASLGEMYQDLTSKGVKIPNGFATTSDAYWHLLEAAGILDKLKEALAGLDKKSNVEELAAKGKRARELILGAKIPEDLWIEIKTSYDNLGEQYGKDTDVAVRSSATAASLSPWRNLASPAATWAWACAVGSASTVCSPAWPPS